MQEQQTHKPWEVELDSDGQPDDIFGHDITLLRIERMSETCFWSSVDVAGKTHVLWFNVVDGKLTLTVEENAG